MSPTAYCLNNLVHLRNLESLSIEVYPNGKWSSWLDGFTLPCSLKKLALCYLSFDNDMMSTVIGGSLPLRQAIKLNYCQFIEDEWNPVEGQFGRLKYLELYECGNLKYWNANNTHFPSLEHLRIVWTSSLEELPSGVGDIDALRLIELFYVRSSAVISAKRMLEEQEQEFGNTGLQIRVLLYKRQEELLSLASSHFETYYDPS